ncbi:MAG: SRPBCC domain-containing protein [Thermoplasmata archaeon]|nr:SRPBCC domain-containing protein [Thermoplasmata archaeon]
MTKKELLSIDQSFFYRASNRRVFRALTDPAELTRWFVAKADLPHEAGAAYRFEWPGGYSHVGTVEEFVPPRRLSLTWPHGPVRGRFYTRVTFTVRRAGPGTFVSVHHTGFPSTPKGLAQYGGTQSGWAYYLLNLRSVLEFGRDLRSPRDA